LREIPDLLNIIPGRIDVLVEPRMSRIEDTNLEISLVANVKAMFLEGPPRCDARVYIYQIFSPSINFMYSSSEYRVIYIQLSLMVFLFPTMDNL